MATNILALANHIQQQGELGRVRGTQSRLNRLTGQAVTAPDAQARDQFVQQAVATDPQAGFALQDRFQSQDDTRAKKAAGAAQYVLNALKSGNPQAVQGAYQTVRPFLVELGRAEGKEPPPAWSPDMEPMLHQVVAASQGAGAGDMVQSTRIGADGYYYTVDRTGRWTNSGIKADPKTQLRDQPGIDPGLVDLRTGTVSPLQAGQGAPQGNGAPSGLINTPDGGQVFIDPSLPANVRADIAANPGKYDGGGIVQAPAVVQPATNAGPAAMRPATPPAGEVESFGQPQAVVGPDGQQRFVQFGNRGGVREVPGYNAAPTSTATAADRKAVQQAQQKLPQLQNAIRGMDRIGEALGKLRGGMVNTGPLDQYVTRYSKEGQELEASVGAIQNSVLALTRVPGVGSQSDLEQRVAMLQYPSLDKDPEVNRRTLENLRLFMADLKAAYDNVTGGVQTPAASSSGGRQYGVGQVINVGGRRYRVTGGDPNDPDLEEVR